MKVSRHTANILEGYLNPQYVLSINPVPTPRPRASVLWKSLKGFIGIKNTQELLSEIKKQAMIHMYSPKEYTTYKKALLWLIKGHRPKIKTDNYRALVVIFYIPYPKSTPKKKLIEGAPHIKKPDWDNYIKGFQDALQEGKIISDDGIISEGLVSKRYTTQKHGRIEFSLIK